LEKARVYGATHTVDSSSEDAAKKIEEILGGLADVVVDGTGNAQMIEKAYDLTRMRGGRCVLFGVLPKDKKISIQTLPLHFGRTLTGSEGGQSCPHEDIPAILSQIAGGDFDASGFINRRGSLAEVNEVISEMRSGSVVHAVLSL
jgi:S-(hydroxymethyl)glutathione dehydrogenase/alcohol dehydrogenase